jgi:hypothetical protein
MIKETENEDFNSGEKLNDYITSFSIEGKFIHVKVGSKDEPAPPNYIDEIEKDIKEKTKGINCIIFVTPHDVEISAI